MSYRFAGAGPIFVAVRLESESTARLGRFLLDTGAQRTLISSRMAAALSIPLGEQATIWTVSGMERIRIGSVARIDALGLTRRNFVAVVANLPQPLNLDGLLGLDFFRDTRLNIDFRSNTVTIG